MRFVPVTSDKVNEVWPHVEDYIVRACDRGPDGAYPDAMEDACRTGRHQLWVAMDGDEYAAAAVTGIWTEPSGRKVCYWAAVGGRDMRLWQPFYPHIEAWAKANGCSAMRSMSRRGMKKRLEPDGYRVTGFILEKAL